MMMMPTATVILTRVTLVGVFNHFHVVDSSETDSRSASQEIPYPLWNPTVQYRVQKIPPLVPNLNQMNSVHKSPLYFSKSHFNIIRPSVALPTGSFLSGFPTKNLYTFLSVPCVLHDLPMLVCACIFTQKQLCQLIPCYS